MHGPQEIEKNAMQISKILLWMQCFLGQRSTVLVTAKDLGTLNRLKIVHYP